MKRTKKLLGLISALWVLVFAPVNAGEIGPVIPKAIKGEQCVEETSEMRKNHMEYLKSHRDETMRNGIRTTKHSLKACLDCHVAPEGTIAAEAEEHFCKNCHSYAGVRLDCFECHATRPEMSALTNPGSRSVMELNSLQRLNQMASNKNAWGAIQ